MVFATQQALIGVSSEYCTAKHVFSLASSFAQHNGVPLHTRNIRGERTEPISRWLHLLRYSVKKSRHHGLSNFTSFRETCYLLVGKDYHTPEYISPLNTKPSTQLSQTKRSNKDENKAGLQRQQTFGKRLHGVPP
ncbi:unnamed protein product, partial [Ectocarpus sp. 13 AM-2016]